MNNRSERIIGAVIIFSLIAMLFSPCHFGPAKSLMTSIALCSGQGLVDQDIAVVDNYIQAVQSNNAQAVGKLLDKNYVGYLSSSDSICKEQALVNLTYGSEHLYEKIEYLQNVHLSVRAIDGPESGSFISDSYVVKITYKDGRGSVFFNALVDYQITKGRITFSRTTLSSPRYRFYEFCFEYTIEVFEFLKTQK